MCLVFLKNSKLTNASELLPNYLQAIKWDFVEDIEWFEDLLPNPNNFFGNKNVAMYSTLVVLLVMHHCFILPHEIGFAFEKIAWLDSDFLSLKLLT